MKRSKRIAAMIIAAIAFLPLVMVFNDDEAKFYINALGIAYGYILFKYGRQMAPKFVLDYFDEAAEEA